MMGSLKKASCTLVLETQEKKHIFKRKKSNIKSWNCKKQTSEMFWVWNKNFQVENLEKYYFSSCLFLFLFIPLKLCTKI